MKRSHWFLAGISLVLLLIGLHPLGWTCVSLFAFAPLFFILFDPDCRRRSLVLYTLCIGILYYGIGLYWLLYFDAGIYALALLAVAPSFAIYFLLLDLFIRRMGNFSLRVLAAPVLWILIQKVYELTPISTIATEVPFYGPFAFFQIASITGYIAVSAAIIGLNASLAVLIKRKTIFHGAFVAFFAFILIGMFAWGSKQLSETKTGESVPQFAIIQHNFPVSGKWRLEHPVFIRSEYRRLAMEAAKQKPDMIIFPLYSFPDDALRSPEFFTGLAQETKTWLLVATYIPQNPGESITRGFFDAALLYSPEGKLVDYYQAVQAPPFRDVSEFTKKEYKVLETPFGKLGILLCYEDALPKMAKKAVQNGAEILIALSNPGHFSSTHMPYYHLIQDRLRAIESNRWLVRASANGYSAIIDPKGRFVQQTRLNEEAILSVNVKPIKETTFYHRTFDWLTISAVGFCMLVLLLRFKKSELVNPGLDFTPGTEAS